MTISLNPVFVPLQERMYTLLSTLSQETRTEALQRVRDVTEHMDGWRALYPGQKVTSCPLKKRWNGFVNT